MSEDQETRIHDPTPVRIQRAREEGQFAFSRELSAALMLLGFIGVLYLMIQQSGAWLVVLAEKTWQPGFERTDVEMLVSQWHQIAFSALFVLLPGLVTLWLISIAAQWSQTGVVWNTQSLAPKLSNLGPRRWLSRISPGRLLLEVGLGVPKMLAGTAVVAACLWYGQGRLIGLATEPLNEVLPGILGLASQVTALLAFTLLLFGALDWVLVWHRYRAKLRMTEQEFRDELRDQEGDAVNRTRQRAISRVG